MFVEWGSSLIFTQRIIRLKNVGILSHQLFISVQQVETFKVNSQSSILKRVGKPANPSRMEFEDYKRNKTMGNGTEYVLQSDTADNEIFAKEVQSNKTGFGNVTSGSFGNSDKSSANVTFSGISSVQSDKSLANTTFGIGGLQSEKTANTT